MGKTFRPLIERAKIYADYVWYVGDPRPSLLGRDEVRALEDTSPKWDFVPAGARFGELTVLGYAFYLTNGGRSYGWTPYCQCSCGWEGCVLRDNLAQGKSTRCDKCAKRAASGKRWWKYKDAMPDDAHRERLLNRLSSIITRCTNKDSRTYMSYGGRGIGVYDGWRKDRAEFLRYVQTLPGWDIPEYELDRIDNDKGYYPGNIRFVSRSENLLNKRHVNDMSQRIIQLEKENAELRAEIERLRHSQCGAPKPLCSEDYPWAHPCS